MLDSFVLKIKFCVVFSQIVSVETPVDGNQPYIKMFGIHSLSGYDCKDCDIVAIVIPYLKMRALHAIGQICVK